MNIEKTNLQNNLSSWFICRKDGYTVYLNPHNVEYLRETVDDMVFGLIDGTEFHVDQE